MRPLRSLFIVAISALLAGGLASCSRCPNSSTQTTAATPAFRIVGYVTNGDSVPAITPGKLDVINFAFAEVDKQHRVVLTSATAPRVLRGLVALRRQQPSLKIVLSIGGWGAGNFSEAAWDDASRARFANSALALVRKYDLDGVDIDWEYPTLPGPGIGHDPQDRQHFTWLVQTLRTHLDALGNARGGRHYLLTIAAAEGQFARGLDLPTIARSLDWINLMSYDFYGSLTPTTGHHAGLYPSADAPAGSRNASAAVDEFLAAGVPASKLHLGVAFYGRRFGDVEPAHDGLLQRFHSDGGFISWNQIASERLGQPGWERHWDAKAQAPWLWNPHTHALISYDDPQSLRAKIDYARRKHLGGIMYWDYRQDRDEQLLDVLVEGRDRQPAATATTANPR